MKKHYTLMIVALLAMLGLNAQAAMWLVGDAFNGWSESGNVEMTNDNGIYTYTANLTAGAYFAFFKDSQSWSSQRGPMTGDAAPSGDWESTKSGGAWKVATTGEYVIQYNYSTDQAKIALQVAEPFDATKRKFVVTGDAFGGWNMPPTEAQTFTNNGDGTYTLVYEGASASPFKLAGVGENDTFDSSWNVFNSGCRYNGSLAVGDNNMVSGNTSNMNFPVSGNVTLTITEVTENSCKLNIQLTQEIIPDKAYYLVGAFNHWSTTSHPFTEVSVGVFEIIETFSGEFKIVNEANSWLGGTKTLTAEDNTADVTEDKGGNMYLADEAEYTLTIENGVLTVTGFPAPEPETKTLTGVVRDTHNNPLAGVTVTAVPVVENNGQGIMRRAEGEYTTTTGADGSFSLEVPADANYNLTFSKEGYSSQTVLEDGINEVTLTEETITGITSLTSEESVVAVKYVNAAGMTSDKPFDGINIKVTTYSDGSTTATKVIK